MISHTDAMDSFYAIMNAEPTYPFNYVLRVNQGRLMILESIAILWVYFKKIGEHRVDGFGGARKAYLNMITFVPDYKVNSDYKKLFEYFQQGLNYTPINKYTDSVVYLKSGSGLFQG